MRQFTKERLRGMVKHLQLAREMLEGHKTGNAHLGVCWALHWAGNKRARLDAVTARDDQDYLTWWVASMLGADKWYPTWINRQFGWPIRVHNTEGAWAYDLKMKAKTREGRIAWVTWMIRTLQKEIRMMP